MIATPRPFFTRLNSVGLEYWRKPGRLILSRDLIAGSFVEGSYFNAILITPCLLSSSNLYFRIYPLSYRISVMRFFRLEAGISTIRWFAICAFRSLVRKSAIGSVTIVFFQLSVFNFFTMRYPMISLSSWSLGGVLLP